MALAKGRGAQAISPGEEIMAAVAWALTPCMWRQGGPPLSADAYEEAGGDFEPAQFSVTIRTLDDAFGLAWAVWGFKEDVAAICYWADEDGVEVELLFSDNIGKATLAFLLARARGPKRRRKYGLLSTLSRSSIDVDIFWPSSFRRVVSARDADPEADQITWAAQAVYRGMRLGSLSPAPLRPS